jgi:hypothetical protein
VEVGSSSKSGRAAVRGLAGAPVAVPVMLTVSGEVVIVLLGGKGSTCRSANTLT